MKARTVSGPVVTLIQGTFDVIGGYAINGREYRSEEAEALVDEAKEMAMQQPGRAIEDVLALIVPAEHLGAI